MCGKAPDGAPLASTGFVQQRERNPAWAVVGQGYVVPHGTKTAGDTVQFEYVQTMSQTQTSTLGIGISGYGVDAGYNTSGTNVSTATEGVDYPKEPKSTWFRTLFSVGQFRTMCVSTLNHPEPHKKQHGKCPRTTKDSLGNTVDVYKCLWLVKSTGWFGPSGSVVHPKHAPSTPAKFCGLVQKGISVKTSKEKAIQWSAGFEIGGSTDIKGVTLKASFGSTAQTGYDANDQMIFTFGHTGYICGTNRIPKNAAQLVMRGNKT